MKKDPQVVQLDSHQIEDLKDRIQRSGLVEEDVKLLIGVLDCFAWIKASYGESRFRITKLLRFIFGPKTEKRTKNTDPQPKNPGAQEGVLKPPPSGHGKNGADEYHGAEVVKCEHGQLKTGDTCPECKIGKVYPQNPGVFIKVVGGSLLTVTKYLTEKLRCNLCGEIFEADLPNEVSKEDRWDPSAKAMTALLKYGYGFPQYRQERLLKDLGIPLSDSTLYDQAEKVANCGYPIYNTLSDLVAKSNNVTYADDTNSKILELIKENKTSSPDRVAIYTSAIIGQHEVYKIYLFKSGRKNAGENLDEIYKKRPEDLGPPRIMVDGSSSNIPETLKAIIHNCLTHGRREFVNLEIAFPEEVNHVLNLLGVVYKNDEHAKNLSPKERLKYHQEHSQKPMDDLFSWLLIQQKKAEPNGNLGKAIKYMLKRKEQMTRFLVDEGAPLDNNTAERAIKYFVLFRKNSYFYKTHTSALIGDILVSLIQTCASANINPLRYLTQIQIYKSLVFKSPSDWLPWNFEQTILNITKSQTQS